nr:MAG TPA: hypothetical protein [Bacteriophage sp.]
MPILLSVIVILSITSDNCAGLVISYVLLPIFMSFPAFA